jgi:hypothetical protein
MIKKFSYSAFKTAACVLLLMLLFAGCHSNRKNRIPDKKFILILVDLHLANAIVTEKRILNLDYQLDSASIYGSVFKKHNITPALFDSTMNYYSARPREFQKLYNQVNAIMKRMEDELAAEQNGSGSGPKDLLWKDGQIYRFPPLTGNKISLDVPINGPGLYTVSATVRFQSGDSTRNPRMMVYFYYDDKTPEGRRFYLDEVRYDQSVTVAKTYSVSGKPLNQQVTHIKGYIMDYSNPDSLFRRDVVVSDITVTKIKLPQ